MLRIKRACTPICLLFVLCLLVGQLRSQSIALHKAERHYESLEYKDAAEMYETVFRKEKGDIRAMRNLANCYLKLNDMPNAEKWFQKVANSQNPTPDDILCYAETLEENNKYEEAKTWFGKYDKVSGTDKRGNRFCESLSHLSDYYRDSANYRITFVEALNTPAAEFSPCYYKNGLLYVAERNHDQFSTSEFMWDKSHFLDLYYSDLENESGLKFSKDHPFNNKMNTKYHEGPVALNHEQNMMVFTRNNYFHKKAHLSSDGVNKLKLFYSRFENNKWTNPENFLYNNDNYSCGHPALTNDGKTMYFVSDMPGSIGGTDIWITTFENGNWSKPVNAGSGINTEGNEMFPALVKDSVLYFASNGLGGLGGLDIFEAQMSNKKPGKIKNMGYPLNSSHDDFGLIYNPAKESGFFSSNRANNKGGGDDIYYFRLNGYFINIQIIDEESFDPLSRANLKIKDSRGNITDVIADEKGKFRIKSNPDTDYDFGTHYENYRDGKSSVSSKGKNAKKDLLVVIPMNRMRYRVEAIVSNNKTKKILNDVSIVITDKTSNDEIFISGKTDMEGSVTKMLKGKKAGDRISFRIDLEKQGYLKKNELVEITLAADSVIRIPLLMDQIALGVDIGKVFDLKPIYFDLDKSSIRPDAAVELDKIVVAMKDNPGIVIELGSHTDCRASAKYNMTLSDKRAKASAAYIIANGISKSRIYGKGYGESKLVNNCGCEGKVQSNCSEEEHQMNRRTEFRIVKIK